MFFLSGSSRPGIHAEQGVHAQEQAQVAAQFHPSADQPDWKVESSSEHLTENGCFSQVDRQIRMLDHAFS